MDKNHASCHKCAYGYKGGCDMYLFWKSVNQLNDHKCSSFISKEREKELRKEILSFEKDCRL